jgi:hypothetical protein
MVRLRKKNFPPSLGRPFKSHYCKATKAIQRENGNGFNSNPTKTRENNSSFYDDGKGFTNKSSSPVLPDQQQKQTCIFSAES